MNLNQTTPVSGNTRYIIPILPVRSTGTGVSLRPRVYQLPAPPPTVCQHPASFLTAAEPYWGNLACRREADAAQTMVALSAYPVHRRRDDPSCPQFSAPARTPESASGRDDISAMMGAIHNEDISALDLLIRSGVPVNLYNEHGRLPLVAAIVKGNTQAIGLLLRAGADPNLTHPSGLSPLIFAVSLGRSAPVEMLLQAGAVATSASCALTALDVARHKRLPEMEKLLNQYGQARTVQGQTPPFHFNLAVHPGNRLK